MLVRLYPLRLGNSGAIRGFVSSFGRDFLIGCAMTAAMPVAPVSAAPRPPAAAAAHSVPSTAMPAPREFSNFL